MSWVKSGSVLAAAMMMAAAIGGWATGDDQVREKEKGRWAGLLNVDVMVETYTQFLVRRYDLTEEQGAYTKQLLTQRASEFMGAHGDEVNALMEGLFDARAGGEMAPGQLVEWGQRAMPIFEEAKRLIVAGNDEWRNILTEEQKKIHDEDLQMMNENFAQTHSQLQRIVSGEMTVEEFRKPQRNTNSTRRPAARTHNRRVQPPAPQPETPVAAPAEADREAPPSGEGSADGDAAGAAGKSNAAPAGLDHRRTDAPPVTPSEESATPPPVEAKPIVQPPVAGESPPPVPPAEAGENDDARKHEMEGRDDHAERGAPPPPPRPRPGLPESGGVQPSHGGEKKEAEVPKGKAEPESRWEQYTREFIERYRLDPGQTQKALDILKDCKEQAGSYLRGKGAQIEALDKRIESSKAEAGPDAKERSKVLSELTEARAKLIEPVDQIFEKQLKPRLEKLPTRAQRQAAEAAKTKSKPGAAGGAKRKSDAGAKKDGD